VTAAVRASRLGGLHVIVGSVDVARAAARGGATVVQVRAKAGTDRSRLALATAVVEVCRDTSTRCVVNDRVDLALAAGAGGVHLGADDLPVADARRLAAGVRIDAPATTGRSDFVVGGTARDADTARRLVADGADYLGVGPVWLTTSKVDLPTPIGVAGLQGVVDAVDVPVVAISGVSVERVAAALATGAAGVAVISAVTSVPDPEAATRALVAALGEGSST
jgi:thiamine-phosphate pyrophosphorylase